MSNNYHHLKMRVVGTWVLTAILLLFSTVFTDFPYSNEIQMVLALPVLLFFCAPFYTGAWKRTRLGRKNID